MLIAVDHRNEVTCNIFVSRPKDEFHQQQEGQGQLQDRHFQSLSSLTHSDAAPFETCSSVGFPCEAVQSLLAVSRPSAVGHIFCIRLLVFHISCIVPLAINKICSVSIIFSEHVIEDKHVQIPSGVVYPVPTRDLCVMFFLY